MSKKTKIWLIAAASFVGLGCMIFGGVMTVLGWDFSKLETMRYETSSYPIEQAITDIRVIGKTADVTIRPSGEGEISVVCREQTRARHTVSIRDGVLEIRLVDERKWYDYIGVNFGSPEITVSVPQGQYGQLSVQIQTGKVSIPEQFSFETVDISVSTGSVTCAASVAGHMQIRSSTGGISLKGLSAGSLELSGSTGKIVAEGITCAGSAVLRITTGDIHLTDFSCKALDTKSSTGDVHLTNVVAAEEMTLRTDTGNVRFTGSDAGRMQINTSTGSVTGSLLSPKIFFAETDTGSVDVPKTTSGGKCEITTDTGSIRITVAG